MKLLEFVLNGYGRSILFQLSGYRSDNLVKSTDQYMFLK